VAFDLSPENVRRARRAAGLTQEELAKRARIERTKISVYETGRIELSAEEKARLDKVFGSLKGEEKSRVEQEFALVQAIDPTAGRAVKRVRERAEMSQREMAFKAGIPRNKFNKFESGTETLSKDELARLDKVLMEAAVAGALKKRRISGYDPANFTAESLPPSEDLVQAKARIAEQEKATAELLKIAEAGGEIIRALQRELAERNQKIARLEAELAKRR
jgi:transcriptional regulator with XRE-family HTH domain